MSKCRRLLHRAQAAPASLKFKELCYLAECYGWYLARERGSHRIDTHEAYPELMNFQRGRSGDAKAYQVRKLLNWIQEQEST